MNSISDPGRPSRRDRRRAQKLIDTAFAEGRLTAADRTLRSQRIEAAASKGDLMTITRDLTTPSSDQLGTALNPTTLSGMRVGGVRPTTSTLGGVLSTPSGASLDLSKVVGRRIKWIVLAVVVGFFATCGLGIFGVVVSAIKGVSSGGFTTSEPTAIGTATADASPAPMALGLHTAAGWERLVAAIKDESGTTEIYDAVVYPEYASLGLDGKDAVDRRLYRDGGWQEGFAARTPITGSLVDLGTIDPEVLAALPDRTAEQFGVTEPTGTYLIVNGYFGSPRILVYIQSDAGSQHRSYDFDGQPLD